MESPYPAPAQVEHDAQRAYAALAAGGIAIVHLDVAYSILARTEDAVRRIYAAKNRSFNKPTGIVGSLAAHDALHVMDDRRRRMVRALVLEHDLPVAVVCDYDASHPALQAMNPFVRANAVKGDTLNLLLNAGPARNRIAEISWDQQTLLVGSSANVSLAGSQYGVADIPDVLKDIADVIIDHGRSKYANDQGLSSTMIDFRDFSIIRRGVCFDRIRDVLENEFSQPLLTR